LVAVTATETHAAIDAVFRIESARLIAGLVRIVGDVGLAEELAQDALVIALEKWPESGVPNNPGAWLMATAKHRAIDLIRRYKRLEGKLQELGHDLEDRQESVVPDLDAAIAAGRADLVVVDRMPARGSEPDRKSTRLNSSHHQVSRMPSSA